MGRKLLDRKDIDESLKWDLSSMIKSKDEMEAMISKAKELTEEIVTNYKGRIKSKEDVNSVLDLLSKQDEYINILRAFVYLKVSVDQGNEENLNLSFRVNNILSKLNSEVSFVELEIMEVDNKILNSMMENSSYGNYIMEILRDKKYALSGSEEELLSLLSNTLESPMYIFNRARLQDMDFGTFMANGKEYPLSFGLYQDNYEYEADLEIRRNAFDKFSKTLRKYENTIAGAYQIQLQKEKTISDLRGFPSVIESLLHPQDVSLEMYNRQIDLIMENLAPHMRKYARLIKKVHNLDEIRFADLKIDIDPQFEPKVDLNKARQYVVESLGVLGEDYIDIINRAFDEKWIDFAQNKGKTTGAFCYSPYGTHPFVLMTWTDSMREVFTIAHELGHGGHFYLSHENQNIFDSRPSTYFIESPSTMNEMLFANYLMKDMEDDRMKRWVLSSLVSKTYYHNFVTHLLEAHYQREVYKIIENGGSVQAGTLNRLKRETLEKFWGDEVIIEEGAELTWMRQQHYYKGLYPYTYSAGLTIATEVSRKILDGQEDMAEKWVQVLKTGGTKNSIELAKMVDVDITTEEPLLNTIEYIGSLIDEIISLTEKIEKN